MAPHHHPQQLHNTFWNYECKTAGRKFVGYQKKTVGKGEIWEVVSVSINNISIWVRKAVNGIGEITQQLRALVPPKEDQIQFPTTTWQLKTICYFNFK